MSVNKMEESEEIQTVSNPKMTLKAKNSKSSLAPENNLERQSSFPLNSPKSSQHHALAKSSSTRCLCSPTTHVGSFRCRHHRSLAAGMPRTGSVGSNLSLITDKYNKSEG
ncbi:hypothetical protein Ddye_027809 [Dipteronia dyeriana]|uniref:Serine-rich protein-like protein n=1 Tax=Dipteronia dyeriana TaxID=168575 RepID=A0AAD9TPT2_9ROSI|nr:hypothetical protein Ddye_027809 [Dipteronia dyeriana]